MRRSVYFVSVLLSLIIMMGVLSGCNRTSDDQPEFDGSKSQLYVGVFDGGFGTEWVKQIGKRFEEKYADHSFEAGKKGVQVYYKANREYATTQIFGVISDVDEEVFFLEQTDYYRLVNEGYALDVTDAVTTPLTEYGENKSIEQKMNDYDISYYKANSAKYYGVPFFEATYGIFYDIDLFENENFFFAENGVDFVANKTATRSKGPDNIAGTFDDGLPATYADFFKLCQHIYSKGMSPVSWSGGTLAYLNSLAQSLWASYEGSEQMMLNFNFSGNATNLIKSINGGVPEFESSTPISNSNGYLLQKQAGKYYALDFLEELIDNKNYQSDYTTSSTVNHLSAQSQFLRSRFDDSVKNIAMHVDGTWWYNEANTTFEQMKSIDGAGKYERRMGILPLPKATADKVGEDFTYYQCYMTSSIIKSNIEKSKISLAKAFYRFCHTNESLSEFTKITSTTKPFDYALEEKHIPETSYYGKSLFDLHTTADRVVPYSTNKLFMYASDVFTAARSVWNQGEYTLIAEAMKTGMTSESYFDGLAKTQRKNTWDDLYRFYF